MNYYNENDAQAAAWLRELVREGHIPPGEVDSRSIEDVTPNDLRPFRQCHFFAGIGGWPYALRLAGWPDDRPVWTGSCPCQPFSTAGKGSGFADERHLWPAWHWLIEQCRPSVVFGEQVASAGEWIDLVCADMEGIGYACGAVVLPACSVGGLHGRQRAWLVAHPSSQGLPEQRGRWEESTRSAEAGGIGRVADTQGAGQQARDRMGAAHESCRHARHAARNSNGHAASPHDNGWDTADWLLCRDGKWRPVEPGTFPLAHGIPARVGRLRGYGNAIVPQVAAAVVSAYMGVDAKAE